MSHDLAAEIMVIVVKMTHVDIYIITSDVIVSVSLWGGNLYLR